MKKYLKVKDSHKINEKVTNTFKVYKTIDAINDVGMLLNIEESKIELLKEKMTDSKTLNELMNTKINKTQSLNKKKIIEFRNLYKFDKDIKKLVDVAMKIEGDPIT